MRVVIMVLCALCYIEGVSINDVKFYVWNFVIGVPAEQPILQKGKKGLRQSPYQSKER